MMVFVIIVFVSACVAPTASLTEECTQGLMECVNEKIQASAQGQDDDCKIGQRYADCVANALSQAEQSGTCDTLSLLAYRHTQYQDIATYPAQCPKFVVPPYLQLKTACDRQLALCGDSAIRAASARSQGDQVQTCRHLTELQQCMQAISGEVCPDQQHIDDLLHTQLQEYQYQATCVDTKTVIPTTMTAKRTATTPTATKTTRASRPKTTEELLTKTVPSTVTEKGGNGKDGNNAGNPLASDCHSQVLLMGLCLVFNFLHL